MPSFLFVSDGVTLRFHVKKQSLLARAFYRIIRSVMSSLSSDHLLFEQIRQKDPATLSELNNRYSHLVFGVALKILNDE
ncbi:MAG TPA: hypothetical protein DEQ80_02670 [Anaerolinea thermolimosa]|uniref:Uncharacterized protein n=1 Tax=Anaerolinea thermolimosa TaxID=229919 RepID=A0A3D1JE17_9CHLR|nr:hypothetical protein [Anaerolinea thermolimosa]